MPLSLKMPLIGLEFYNISDSPNSPSTKSNISLFILQTTNANCLSVGEHFIFIGCADGIVRCFSPQTLQFVTTLPRTHYLG